MTTDDGITDDFTKAARAEAERRTRPPGISGQTLPSMEQFAERDGYRRGFTDAAEWARTHLAQQEGHRRVRKYADDWDTCTCGYDAWPCRSQEPTDAEVGAAFWAFTREHFMQAFSREHGDQGPSSRQSMRAALSAARAARRDEEKR